jgi:hypothetical protein
MVKQIKSVIYLCLCSLLLASSACSTSTQVDNQDIKLINRDIIIENGDNKDVLSLDRKKGDGLAILKNMQFETGVIELDLRGEDLQGKSFVGFAFNIQDESTYEVIYFRPFNFQAEDKARREHGIQYIHPPEFTWKKLRTEQEGVFEAEFINPPSPDDWFIISLTISDKTVIVRDKRTGEILMEVTRLTESKSKKIGFWTGFNSKGSFRNLKIVSK